MGKNVSGPEDPSRRRFPNNKESVAPARWSVARFVLQAVVLAGIRKVIDLLLP